MSFDVYLPSICMCERLAKHTPSMAANEMILQYFSHGKRKSNSIATKIWIEKKIASSTICDSGNSIPKGIAKICFKVILWFKQKEKPHPEWIGMIRFCFHFIFHFSLYRTYSVLLVSAYVKVCVWVCLLLCGSKLCLFFAEIINQLSVGMFSDVK